MVNLLECCLLLLVLPLQSLAFSPATSNGVSISLTRPTAAATAVARPSSSWTTTSLMAKKRRRRKTTDDSPAPAADQSDELPDFDDGEAEYVEVDVSSVTEETPMKSFASTSTGSPSKTITPVRRGDGLDSQLAEEVGGNVDGLDQDTILGAMRGKAGGASWEPPRSIEDTLTDRSLEKFMDFDKMIAQDGNSDEVVDLPDFDEVISRRKQREAMQEGRVEDVAMLIDTTTMGKKAAKNAARKAAAIQREIEEEENKNPFEDLKELNILKLLENGAWLGIGLLVLWEFYINSPLFDRASPLIPVVFDETTPGM